MQIKHCTRTDTSIEIVWQDDSHSSFPFIWLRDMDALSFHESVNERMLELCDLPFNIQPEDFTITDNGFTLQWPNEKERSVFTTEWLATYRPDQTFHDPAQIDYVSWRDELEVRSFSAPECKEGKGLSDMLCALKRYGTVVITDLEDDEKAGELFGDHIGLKRRTTYGEMFEVIAKPETNNLAYTPLSLPLHTDLPYHEPPPGYQFLHCYANAAIGGESVVADGFAIAEDMKREAPDLFGIIINTKVPFRFHDQLHDIRRHQKMIDVHEDGRMKEIIFSAHFYYPPSLPHDEMIAFYEAYYDLMKRIRRPEYRIEWKLKAGEMLIFDNRRVFHARNAFDPNSGYRHLRGYYIDHQDVDSRIRILNT